MCSEISYMFKRCPVLARQHGNSFRGKIEESRLCPELDSFRRQLWGDSSFTMPKALAPRHSDLCFASLRDQPLIAIYCHNKGSKDFGARDTGCHTLPRIPKNGPVRKTCWASQSFLVLEHLKPWQLVLNHKLQWWRMRTSLHQTWLMAWLSSVMRLTWLTWAVEPALWQPARPKEGKSHFLWWTCRRRKFWQLLPVARMMWWLDGFKHVQTFLISPSILMYLDYHWLSLMWL